LKQVKAPTPYTEDETSIFVAGGIKKCPNWQSQLVKLLKTEEVVLLNPRRAKFPKTSVAAQKQIEWEHTHLKIANAISFWFPKETLCPITLYELGAWSMRQKKLFIGVHPEYAKRFDVETQTALARPEVKIVYSLEALAAQIKSWLHETK
jgi:hypothetical protein